MCVVGCVSGCVRSTRYRVQEEHASTTNTCIRSCIWHDWRLAHVPSRGRRPESLSGEIQQAHGEAKRALLDEVKRRTGIQFDPATLTIGFARRAATYKRADLLFTDLNRLRRIIRQRGPLQVVYGGKAHP